MQNQENEELDITGVFTHLLDMCKHMAAGPDGKVPEELASAFENILQDTDGKPLIQSIAGMVMCHPDEEQKKVLYYSPNLNADPEHICIEVSNFTKYLAKVGYELLACTAHFVDFEGKMSHGLEARKIKEYVDQTVLLQKIKHLQETQDLSKPKLILPESRIVR